MCAMKSTIQKMVLSGVLNVLAASGVQADSQAWVYDTLSLVQQVVAVSHPSSSDSRYWSQADNHVRYEYKLDDRRGLIGYTNPCMSRSNRYDGGCQLGNSHRRHDKNNHHNQHRHDDHRHGKYHNKHSRDRQHASHRSCSH
jgi:hypothetical protein